jgi:hypothetical protein
MLRWHKDAFAVEQEAVVGAPRCLEGSVAQLL